MAGSEHTRGMPANIHMLGLALQQMHELALEISQFADGGIGAYDSDFLHVDVRGAPSPLGAGAGPARWHPPTCA